MSRTRNVTINKEKLINTLKENKSNHIKDYEEAVEAYIIEVNTQLKDLKKRIDKGELDIQLALIKPVNSSEKYDEIIELFNWELNDTVELTKSEFDDYVLDKAHFAEEARFYNSSYKF